MRRFLTGATILAALLCTAGNGNAEAAPLNVLFIGNSYTHFNDMPVTLAAMGRSLGYDIRPEFCTVGGASFSLHSHRTKTLQAIASQQWDVVVLQDYSLDPSLGSETVRERSLPEARALVDHILENRPSTRIIYYETWGRRSGDLVHCAMHPNVCTFDGHADALKEGYRIYQKETGGDIAHVGTNWQHVVHDSPSSRPFAASTLWVNDGSHPSRLGSYLAAATILQTIIAVPVGLSDYSGGLPPAAARYLRQVVDAHP